MARSSTTSAPTAEDTSASVRVDFVPFHDETIAAITDVDGSHWIVLQPICARLGLTIQNQLETLKTQTWAIVREIRAVAADGSVCPMECLHIRSFPSWLFSIKSGKSRAEGRAVLTKYQRDAADVLYHHFLAGRHGVVAANDETPSAEDGLEQAHLIVPRDIGFGVIGARNASVLILGPLRRLGEAWCKILEIEPSKRQQRRQRLRCEKELRQRVGFGHAPAHSWRNLPAARLGDVVLHVFSMERTARSLLAEQRLGRPGRQMELDFIGIQKRALSIRQRSNP